jgi:hypothetical protein
MKTKKWIFFTGFFFIFLLGVLLGNYFNEACIQKDHNSDWLNTMKSKFASADMADVPLFEITIDEKTLEKLDHKRHEAIKKGFLLKDNGNDEFVSAKLNIQNQTYAIKLRLKGDYPDHLSDEKWSTRIKSDIPIMGMKKFSLQHPGTRNFISEWFYHKVLAHEGFISLQYFFVRLKINGKNKGIYAVEEFFDEELLKRYHYPPTPIMKFNEDYIWTEMSQYVDSGIHKGVMWNNLFFLYLENSSIDAFTLNKMMDDSLSQAQFIYAKDLLFGFLDRKLPASEVFDMEKAPRFMALCEALGAEHALFWNNLRFYFNPDAKLLEPIGYDGTIYQHEEKAIGKQFISDLHEDTYLHLLLSDSIFVRNYIYWINYYSQADFLNNMELLLKDSIQKNLDILHAEWPDVSLPHEIWNQNREFIQSSLFIAPAFHASVDKINAKEILIKIENTSGLPLQINQLIINDSIVLFPAERTILLRYPENSIIKFPNQNSIHKNDKLELIFQVYGLSDIRKQKVVFP